MIPIWPSLVLLAPLLITLTARRNAWNWLSLAFGLALVWGILMIVTYEWGNGRSGGILATLLHARTGTGAADRTFHDTYYVIAHLKWLGGLAIPAAMIGALQFLPAHPKRAHIDIVLFWATVGLLVAISFGPTWYFLNGGMPRRYIDHDDTFMTVNTLTNIGGLILFTCALIAIARPVWSWWRNKGEFPDAL